MSTVKVILTSGQPTEFPEANLENFMRLNGHLVRDVIREDNRSYEEILDDIDSEEAVVTEVNESPRDVRFNELMNSDRDVLFRLAVEIADKKDIKKPHHASGKEKLSNFILDNQ